MWRETNVLGMFMAPLVVYMLAALALYLPLRLTLARSGLLRFAWNTPLAGTALYVCILGALVTWL